MEVAIVQEFAGRDIVLIFCVGGLEKPDSQRKISDEMDDLHRLIDHFHISGLQLL